MSPKITIICDRCGKPFERWPSHVHEDQPNYCSPKCQNAARRERVTVTCQTCGEEFELAPSRIRESGNYCSPECAYEARRLHLGEPPFCACGCGQPVTSTRHGEWCKYIHGHSFRGRHHSSETRKKLSEIGLQMSQERSERIRGENNPVWRGGHRDVYFQERKEAGWNWWQARKMRESLISKCGHVCERCRATDVDLELHHIDHDLFNNDPENFQLLCRGCHAKVTAEFVAAENAS